MSEQKEKMLRSQDWALNPNLKYMKEEDRYFLNTPTVKFKLAIIGLGVNGQEHIRCTHFEGRAMVYGVFDTNEDSISYAKKEHEKYSKEPLIVYSSLDQAIENKEIDGFIISTPNHTHLDIFKKVMKSKKAILLEKPMTPNVKEAYSMIKLTQDYPNTIQLGLQYRYKSIYRESLYEALERKTLGEIKMINLCEHRIPFLDKVGQWNKFTHLSGGTLVEKCCHYFDLCNLFAQSNPKRVLASGSQWRNFKDYEYNGQKSDILDNTSVIIEYENGVVANFNLCMFAPQFHESLSICGDEGRLQAEESQDYPGGEDSKSLLSVFRGEMQTTRKMQLGYPKAVERLGHHGSTLMEHKEFIDRLENKTSASASLKQGFWAVVVGEAAQKAILEKQNVDILPWLKSLNVENV